MTAAALHILIVAVAGVVGGIARFWVSGYVAHRIGERFPWGTLVVNTTGALGIGVLAALLPPSGTAAASDFTLWLALAVGVLGSYTTVSSFSLQTLALIRESEWLNACLNVTGSLGLCLAAAAAGYLSALGMFGS